MIKEFEKKELVRKAIKKNKKIAEKNEIIFKEYKRKNRAEKKSLIIKNI